MLFVFVEGSDDRRFFKHYYKSQEVNIIPYKTMPNKKIASYINSAKALKGDYLFFADADGATIEHKMEKVAQKYPMVDKSKIIIVQQEIESWYLAGLDKTNCTKYKIKYLERTDEVSKEKFDSMIPKKLDHASFQMEILKHFDKTCAKNRNYSFDTFTS